MTEIESTDYHDFVFREGKLVGEFEQMYRQSKEVPWHQDRDAERLDCKLALEIAQASGGNPKKIAEVGCGLGYFANLLALRVTGAKVTGFDVSQTAVSKARDIFPNVDFAVLNVALKEQHLSTFDLVCIRGCFWYLTNDIETVVSNLNQLVSSRGYLLIVQNFPPLDRPFVGKDVIPSPDALVEMFLPGFDAIIDCRLDDRSSSGGNDNWLIFLGRKKINS